MTPNVTVAIMGCMTTEQTRKRRPYRRPSHYGPRRAVAFRPEVDAALEAAADAMGQPIAEIVRRCVDRGLPLVRKAARRAAEGGADVRAHVNAPGLQAARAAR